MSNLRDRFIEQCQAEEVLSSIIDNFVQNPVSRAVKKMDEVKTEVDTKAAEVIAAMPSTSGLATSSDVSTVQSSIEAKIGTPASGQPTDLFAAIAAGGGGGDAQESTSQDILAKVQSLIDNSTIQLNYDGLTFSSGHAPRSAFDVLNTGADLKQYLTGVVDYDDSYVPYMSAATFPLLETFKMENATHGGGYTDTTLGELYRWMEGSTTLKKVILPNFIGKTQGSSICKNMQNLILADFTKAICTYCFSGNTIPFQNCVKLIDLRYGAGVTNSTTLLNNWNPSYVLSTNPNGNDLVTDEGISTNLEQLLYNIREHIAANLRTDVGNKTITFSAEIKAAILADSATLNSFPSNWTIA